MIDDKFYGRILVAHVQEIPCGILVMQQSGAKDHGKVLSSHQIRPAVVLHTTNNNKQHISVPYFPFSLFTYLSRWFIKSFMVS
jgi:hypothetical protein